MKSINRHFWCERILYDKFCITRIEKGKIVTKLGGPNTLEERLKRMKLIFFLNARFTNGTPKYIDQGLLKVNFVTKSWPDSTKKLQKIEGWNEKPTEELREAQKSLERGKRKSRK